MYQLYKSGDRYKVFMDVEEKVLVLFNPQIDDMLHKWRRVAEGETLEDLGFSIHDYFRGKMKLSEVSQFLESIATSPNAHRFGTHRQWRAIATINKKHNKNFAPTSYDEMKEILSEWLF